MSQKPFTPVEIGPLTVPNRLALAPVKTALGGTDGRVAPPHVAYYRRRAQGGAGLLIVEPLYVDPMGREHPKQLGAEADDAVEGLRRIADAVHEQGALLFAHLNHAGRAANPKVLGGPPEAPSAVACPASGATPSVMSTERAQTLIHAFAGAATRVKDAGFDGVEVQLGLGYLAAQFLSEKTNLRDDAYGPHGENRWRFASELVSAVREAAGGEMALTARISAEEKAEQGLSLDDALELAHRLERWGVQGLHVVTGSACDSPPWYYQHMALPEGVNERLSARIREAVSIPVMVAGRLGDPERIRTVLEEGMADLVALGRPLVADPDLPVKMRHGREEEILECGSCLQGCLARVKSGKPIGCLINPEVGAEAKPGAAAARTGSRMVVVGGGPSGMQAALSASRRGWDVVLLEKETRLGGQFPLAFRVPHKDAMERPFRSMVKAVERAGVEIRTGVDATAEEVQGLKPDRVVLATGSRPAIPPISGLDDPLTAEEVLAGVREPGHRVLILGGGMVGIEMAEHLARAGREVVVTKRGAEMAPDMEAVTRKLALMRLDALGVTLHTETHVTKIAGGEIFARSSGSEEERSLGRFDSVLVCAGQQSHDPLSGALEAAGIPSGRVGDASQPAGIFEATQSGHRAAIEDPA